MTNSPNLNLPYIAAGQSQKHVTHNEALRRLDFLAQIVALSRQMTEPPATPEEGDCYLVPAAATGIWAGHAQELACFIDGAWDFCAARPGWRCWLADENLSVFLRDGSWQAETKELQKVELLGVNSNADSTTRFAVNSPGSLFSHGGTDHRMRLNKAAPQHTASVVFQSGFSGRAEIGLSGNNRLSFKVSENGTTWNTALNLTEAGLMGMGTADPVSALDIRRPDARVMITHDGPGGGNTGIGAFTRDYPTTANQSIAQVNFGSRGGSDLQVISAGIRVHAEAGWTGGTSHPTDIRIHTTPAGQTTPMERMRVLGSGRVGIGTTNPTATLHVAGEFRLGSYSLPGLPGAASAGAGAIIYITNESGGAVLAFSDGTNWRRVTDRAIVS